MARSGKRLVIGAAGPMEDDDFVTTGRRGEVRRYQGPTEAQAAEEQRQIDERTAAQAVAAASNQVIVVGPPATESGGDSPASAQSEDAGVSSSGPGTGEDPSGGLGEGAPGGTEGGPGGGTGTGGDDGGGDFKRGGLVGRSGGSVEEGEYVLPRGAVERLGLRYLEKLRSGGFRVMSHADALKHYGAAGSKVNSAHHFDTGDLNVDRMSKGGTGIGRPIRIAAARMD